MKEVEMARLLCVARSEGTQEAWDTLLAALQDHFGRLLSRRRVDAHVAEDVIQDALFLVWSRQASVRNPDRFRSWATSVVLNRLRTTLTRRVQIVGSECDDVADRSPSPEGHLLRSEARQWLHGRLRSLKTEGSAIRMSVEGELSSEDASRALGVTSRSFRRIVRRGLKRLREQVGDQEAELLALSLAAS
ncbi:MAG TPA: sigma-70 family RNA polymerase sigma factor [Planctomycetota bacterium]|jgi:RNA polymerase sigma-70 factor (ECF subfamily)|nr:sigma-70 family RNA polymerase sigma factor [Planctomycetota bacterium]